MYLRKLLSKTRKKNQAARLQKTRHTTGNKRLIGISLKKNAGIAANAAHKNVTLLTSSASCPKDVSLFDAYK